MPKSQQNASSLERGWGVEPSRRGTQWGDQGTPEPFIFKTDHVLWWKIKCTLLPWIQTPMQRESHHWSWALMVLNFQCFLQFGRKPITTPIYCITILPPNSRRVVNIWKRGLRCLSINTNTNLSECLSTNTSNPWFSPEVTLSSTSSSSSTFLWKYYKE